MWDAGSRQRRHRILQSVGLRRQRGELTGYSLQIRLLSCGTLRERHQHSCTLLLRRLNILQCGGDGIWYRGGSRLTWRLRSGAIGSWAIGSGAIESRQREAIEIWQRELIEIRQREVKIRQRVGGGRADDGQGG